MIKHSYTLIIILIIIFSCEYFPNKLNDTLIARAGNSFLYHSELKENLKFSYSSDSLLKTKKYINNWARNHLLFEKSKINLSEQTLNQLKLLVNDYRYDLYARTYEESIVENSLDTLIGENEILNYYNLNSSNFKLNEELIQVRFISLPYNNIDIKSIKKKFISFKKNDHIFLDSLSFQFSSSNLNDSIWVTKRDFIKSVKIIQNYKNLNFIKKSKFFQLEDSLELYLFFIKNHLHKNEIAPLAYVKNTIKKIVFNKRKLKFIRKFEKEIIQDAIQTNKFEIYQ